MWDALRACLSELKHGGTKSTETHGGVGDTVDRQTELVECGAGRKRPSAHLALRASSCPPWLRASTRSGQDRDPSAMVGIGILAAYVLASAAGPLVFRYDPVHQNLADAFLPSSLAHPLGTDDLGRDELVRLLYGT